jgi:hypothetical protein
MNKQTNNDGGPAFAHSGSDCSMEQKGMTLRDYFATQAMQGLLAQDDYWTIDDLAEQSFYVADTMLAERSKPSQRKDEGL